MREVVCPILTGQAPAGAARTSLPSGQVRDRVTTPDRFCEAGSWMLGSARAGWRAPGWPRAGRDVVLRTAGLTKRYGRVVALDGLNLEVGAGEVHAFLGPNGAG